MADIPPAYVEPAESARSRGRPPTDTVELRGRVPRELAEELYQGIPEGHQGYGLRGARLAEVIRLGLAAARR